MLAHELSDLGLDPQEGLQLRDVAQVSRAKEGEEEVLRGVVEVLAGWLGWLGYRL